MISCLVHITQQFFKINACLNDGIGRSLGPLFDVAWCTSAVVGFLEEEVVVGGGAVVGGLSSNTLGPAFVVVVVMVVVSLVSMTIKTLKSR